MKKHFEETRCMVDGTRSGRRQTSMTTENTEKVALTFVEDSHQSAQKVVKQLDIPRTSVSHIMKKLSLRVYHPVLLQVLNEDDYQKSVESCKSFVIQTETNPTFENCILWSNEAAFKTNGIATENPNLVITQKLNAPGMCLR